MSDAVRHIAILGATSSIAQHTARLLAPNAHLALVARNPTHLDRVAADLRAREARSLVLRVLDLAAVDDPRGLVQSLAAELGGLDAVMIFYGALGEQATAEADVQALRNSIRTNFTSAAELGIAAASYLETSEHRDPVLLVVGSVAGDRGRASNYVYGSAKGALGVVCEGLTHKYAGRKPRVVLVKPGFVDTPMTQGLAKPGPLWAKPQNIASIIVRALAGGGPVIYAPWYWRWIMLVIRLLPQWAMNRLRI